LINVKRAARRLGAGTLYGAGGAAGALVVAYLAAELLGWVADRSLSRALREQTRGALGLVDAYRRADPTSPLTGEPLRMGEP